MNEDLESTAKLTIDHKETEINRQKNTLNRNCKICNGSFIISLRKSKFVCLLELMQSA